MDASRSPIFSINYIFGRSNQLHTVHNIVNVVLPAGDIGIMHRDATQLGRIALHFCSLLLIKFNVVLT